MLALAPTSATELYHFEFGEPLDEPVIPLEERVRWILADLDARRDTFVSLSLSQCAELLSEWIEEAQDDAAKLLPLIRALGFLRSPSSGPLLERYLSHPATEVRREAILALGRAAEAETLAAIRPSLQSPIRELRRAAIIGLSKSLEGGPFAEMERAAGTDPELQELLRQGRRRLEAVRSRDPRAFVDAVIETEEYDDLVRLSPVVEDHVVEVLADRARDRTVRRRALWLVKAAHLKSAGRVLADILAGERGDVEFLREAAMAAGQIRSKQAFDPLVALLDHGDPAVAEAAVTSLGQIGLPQALRPVLGKWDDRGGALRAAIRLAAFRLGNIGAETAADSLRSDEAWEPVEVYFIDDKLQLTTGYREGLLDGELASARAEARRDAILLMAYLAGSGEAAKIEARRTDEDPTVRELANLAVSRMRSRRID